MPFVECLPRDTPRNLPDGAVQCPLCGTQILAGERPYECTGGTTEHPPILLSPDYVEGSEVHDPYRIVALDALAGWKEGGKLCCIGAPEFVKTAKEDGWDATGRDTFPVGNWDVVVLAHFVPGFPATYLKDIRGTLNLGGVVLVEMWEYQMPGTSWVRVVTPPARLCYSKMAAEQLYAACGLDVIAYWRPMRGQIGKMTHLLVPK